MNDTEGPKAPSPLSEVDPNSLDELMSRLDLIFEKPPLEVTEKEIEATVLYLRRRREEFLLQQAKAAADGAMRAVRSPKKPKPTSIAEALKPDLGAL